MKSLLGAVVGLVVGLFLGGIVGCLVLGWTRPIEQEHLMHLANLIGAGAGSIAGAVVGAASDIVRALARLEERHHEQVH